MIGQEPRLPVDFLLGRVTEFLRGEVQNWVVEHRARLWVAFEGAQERLQAAADRRKEGHDRRVRDAPFSVGQQVDLKDLGAQGRLKIRDLWSSVVHQVVRPPSSDGAENTVAPVGKTRNVHRDMVKAAVPSDAVGCAIPALRSPPLPTLVASADDSSDSEIHPASCCMLSSLAACRGPSCKTLEHAGLLPPVFPLFPSDQPSTIQQALHQIVRSTAG